MTKSTYPFILFLLLILANACSTIRPNPAAVKPFEKDRYLGKWHEIARLDFKFERNLINTTADYTLNEKGNIQVVNQGFDTIQKKWTQVTGKAKFVGSEDIGQLKVSFFGPFYSGYNVIAVDETYTCALVAGSSLKYLWILSRDTNIPEETKRNFLKIAEDLGYKTANLIWVEHNQSITH